MVRWSHWRPYVPAARRQAQAARAVRHLAKAGQTVEPVVIDGRKIAHTFWGKAWCENLERYSDFSNRLPRGRTYVRNGSVIDLQVRRGRVEALVSGSEIYEVQVDFKVVGRDRWKALKESCAGGIDSVVELLQGRFSDGVMAVLTATDTGLFPSPREIEMSCSCPDYATMCKHVAAVLYGIGARLDGRPEVLFTLRGVDHAELITQAAATSSLAAGGGGAAMDAGELSSVFGIELEPETAVVERAKRPTRRGAVAPAARPPARPLPPPRPRKAAAAEARGKDPLVARVRALRRYFGRKDILTNADYRALFGVPPAEATRELDLLTKRRVLLREGRKRGTRYLVGMEMW
jgi:uncharacterized Zn finger protein